MNRRGTKFWIIVASKDHVKKGMSEGIAQACHGKASPLLRMHKGDFVIYYSSRHVLGNPSPCKEFTAIGKVVDETVYSFRMSENFCPSRRNITYFRSKDISILPFIEHLSFIKNKKYWGYPFRFGFFEINRNDFDLISSNMLLENDDKQNRISV